MEIFRQDVFWKELLIEKRECNEKMLNLRRKRVAGEREDEVLAMKKKLQEIVECLKGRKELLRKDEEFNFEGRMKEWLKKSGEKDQECVEHTLRKDQKITKNTKNICLKDKKREKTNK